jgi:DNA replication protein DnaC
VSEPCSYRECDGSGFVIDEATNTARPCRCRPQKQARARAAQLSARIPARYRDVAFDRNPVAEMDRGTVEPIRRFVDDIDANIDAGRGLWIFGHTGTGKTVLGMLVARAALEAGRSTAIYSVPRLFAILSRGFEEEGKLGFLSFLEHLASVDLLYLDDLAYRGDSVWIVEQLFSIVNSRYEEKRSILITSADPEGEPPEEDASQSDGRRRTDSRLEPASPKKAGDLPLSVQIGEKTVSRLREMCGEQVPLFGQDRRRMYAPVD